MRYAALRRQFRLTESVTLRNLALQASKQVMHEERLSTLPTALILYM